MKKLIIAFTIPMLFFSCSEDNITGTNEEEENNGNETETIVPLSLTVSTQEGKMFENIQFTIDFQQETSMYDLVQSYDSLVWNVPEVDGRKKIFEHNSNNTHLTSSWGNCFYYKGKYQSILIGYKDNKVVLADTTIVNVDINKKYDFLNIKWDDFKEIFGTQIINNVFDSEFYLGVARTVKSDTLCANIYFYPEDKIAKDDKLLSKYTDQRQERNIIDYISELYGKPALSYVDNNERLAVVYKEKFRVKYDSDVPIYLWIVGKTNVVLLYRQDAIYVDKYYLHAEPVK
ncbi:hypothetical protein E2605_16755 [Dysgonomonas capnocytophagoides]|uniref:Uncharacterized protein n=1 Tax=Dysgonomonas capnocytophagoides TaxID=45254 RepID=A0A4Y8KWZ5_9BACT|nr:hypothetical protein [Dysgonomonas capnocytophagoides]TFD93798.1 hypothetical protein E2605_16755 [Dysgonomonas capnocytophagoides]